MYKACDDNDGVLCVVICTLTTAIHMNIPYGQYHSEGKIKVINIMLFNTLF